MAIEVAAFCSGFCRISPDDLEFVASVRIPSGWISPDVQLPVPFVEINELGLPTVPVDERFAWPRPPANRKLAIEAARASENTIGDRIRYRKTEAIKRSNKPIPLNMLGTRPTTTRSGCRHRQYGSRRPTLSWDEPGDPRFGAVLMRYFGTRSCPADRRPVFGTNAADLAQGARADAERLQTSATARTNVPNHGTAAAGRDRRGDSLARRRPGPATAVATDGGRRRDRPMILRETGAKLLDDTAMDLWKLFSQQDPLCTGTMPRAPFQDLIRSRSGRLRASPGDLDLVAAFYETGAGVDYVAFLEEQLPYRSAWMTL